MSDAAGGVRGRDFTGYRIAGALSALLFLVLLAWQIVFMLGGGDTVTPEVAWSSAATEGPDTPGARTGGGTLVAETLTARTRLQDERFRTGPSAEGDVPERALDPGTRLTTAPLEDGSSLTAAWAVPDDDSAAMMHESGRVEGRSSLPYANAALFERPFARDWRIGMSDVITHMGALAILGMAFLLSAVLALRGRVPIRRGKSGRTVKRFGFLERATHWLTAISFLGLSFTGLAIAYGETLFVPLGARAMGTLGWWSTWGHVLFAPTFFLGILIMAVMWTAKNLPSRLDAQWLAQGGGFFSDDGPHPPARKFNAGQKLIFWSAILGGLVMVLTGVTLMFPFYWLDLGGMSWAMLIHAAIAVLLIAVFLAHIYIGSVGMHGAVHAMWSGRVDRNWAAEHHDLWLKENASDTEGAR
ncbi:Formate dehydrogenase, nitrate-inducible, cytochrome b556(Fdn) subunit [Roseivivax jejudonensis]|uniref:Formate dehydrogenase, nitrate-inducible, cytochrome b556(Fdn) subunit n=1 Tax=Roseivivax jejudonensis TaxID=1529041 RepID=A0A1X6ZYI3_9RHOB|nr:formate dehydrogenase subunit gamma [Roseivivax jejudonensis]SLN65328.1 Formate dehydrogenase, nitrate-inducible, cytochrome b556(Fdn) subunit [Roseivivax jejudonensis]